MGNYLGRQQAVNRENAETEADSGSVSRSARSATFHFVSKVARSISNADIDPQSQTKTKCSIEKMPHRVEHLLALPRLRKEIQEKHGWNPYDKSINIFVKADKLTLHRRPISQSTDSIRGKVGYNRGIHIWEIKWVSNQRGTHACVGVATKRAPVRKAGYCSLIGNNRHSWGWDLGRNVLRHNEFQVAPACLKGDQENHNKLYYPPLDDSDTSYIVPSTFQCVLDMDAGTLGFIADGQWLGTAFSGLQGHCLYPTVSCVWGHCEVTMKYIKGYGSHPLSLKEIARQNIRSSMVSTHGSNVNQIPLPASLRRYIRDYGLKFFAGTRNRDAIIKFVNEIADEQNELENQMSVEILAEEDTPSYDSDDYL